MPAAGRARQAPKAPAPVPRFRASSDFEVVPLANLSPSEAQVAQALAADLSWFGILRPLNPSRSPKSISRDVASLLEELETPVELMEAAPLAGEPSPHRGLLRLLLDGVIELETESGFRSGPGVLPLLRDWGWLGRASAQGLSLRAIEYGALLPTSDRIWLSGRLYSYNRWPLSAKAYRALSERGIDAVLGLTPSLRQTIARSWTVSEDRGPWIRFQSRRHGNGLPTHKLYVSAGFADVADAVAATIDVFSRSATPGFKVAGTIEETPRPDRLVGYFPDRESLLDVAGALDQALSGLSSQGVPFTAPIGHSGLLSWGMDPPADPSRLPWQGPSWRRWITDQLASAIIDAQTEGPAAAADLAVARISLEGIDPASWTPGDGFWQRAA